MNKTPTQSATGPMQVPLLDLTIQYRALESDLKAAVERVLSSGRYILGGEVNELESEIAKYCGSSDAVGCASGTDALHLSLRALRIGSEDEVITPGYSFFSSASVITLVGAKPVFCDIEPDTYNIDPKLLEKCITPRTKAIIVVHLFGQCADMDAIGAIAKKHGLPIIEDACQSLGADWKGRRAGNIGEFGCFSFFPTKNLGGAGDGGIVTTSDETHADRLRLLRGHGARPKYHHEEIGLNSRLDALQAALLRVKLPHLDRWAEGRAKNADRYRERLSGSSVALPVTRPEAKHVYNQFVIRHERRDELRKHLQENGIGTEVYYPEPLHVQPCFAEFGYREGDLPVAERASRESLALPIFPDLSEEQIDYVAERIVEFDSS